MSKKVVVAEYHEDDAFDTISFSKDFFVNNTDDNEDEDIVFIERDGEDLPEEDVTFSEDMESSDEEAASEIRMKTLPGSTVSYAEDEFEEKKEEKITNWADDRDVTKFMNYIDEAYPHGIPNHNGKSIVPIERAINYLNRVNKEISEAVRMDTSNVLDVEKLDEVRAKIYSDIIALKNHIKVLEKRLKTAEDESDNIVKISDLKKEATTAKIQLVMTPFERAISGIIINSAVSAGHPIDDVFEHLKDKYELDEREELAILQLLMDMGFPIFKDRGTLGEENDSQGQNRGVDFVRNYFS